MGGWISIRKEGGGGRGEGCGGLRCETTRWPTAPDARISSRPVSMLFFARAFAIFGCSFFVLGSHNWLWSGLALSSWLWSGMDTVFKRGWTYHPRLLLKPSRKCRSITLAATPSHPEDFQRSPTNIKKNIPKTPLRSPNKLKNRPCIFRGCFRWLPSLRKRPYL